MPNLQQRKEAFVRLGEVMRSVKDDKLSDEYASMGAVIQQVQHKNKWFTPDNVKSALAGLGQSMTSDEIDRWISKYQIGDEGGEKRIGIIMAGNIPAVGFHDLMCVLLSGNKAVVKLSSDDDKIIPELVKHLESFESLFSGYVEIKNDKLGDVDAVIATGSDNTARYFEYYFGHLPHVIRKNRNSAAIITGQESEDELKRLGHDIFDYFGLGCRSVAKLYVPTGFDFDRFFKAIYDYSDIINHNKYANNYDYNKAVWLLNKEQLLDNGFILLKEDQELISPTGTLYYEYYEDGQSLNEKLDSLTDRLQCIVGKDHIPFGESQNPAIDDYADGFDTMRWLESLI